MNQAVQLQQAEESSRLSDNSNKLISTSTLCSTFSLTSPKRAHSSELFQATQLNARMPTTLSAAYANLRRVRHLAAEKRISSLRSLPLDGATMLANQNDDKQAAFVKLLLRISPTKIPL